MNCQRVAGAWPKGGDLLQICALGLCLFLNQVKVLTVARAKDCLDDDAGP